MDFVLKDKYNIEDLISIVSVLRSPKGCPWDIEQTHESIRQNFLEETYEAVEAIDNNDSALLKEELGDVLLQVVFHSQMESEAGNFTFSEVVNDICQKLIVRHPHVFGDVKAETTAQVLSNWDDIKKQTKGQKSQTDAINSVSKALPALMRSEKIQKKAAKVGFDWADVNGALLKLDEEIAELKQAVISGTEEEKAEELGDVLFSAVNVSRFIDVDSELALTRANDKFISRFSEIEKLAAERGLNMREASLEQLDELWDEVKRLKK